MLSKSPRYPESMLRMLLNVLGFDHDADPAKVAKRLEQLRRGLEPEDEISLILSWLGHCRLVHKLGQEQLPIVSADTYKVPDLLAVFDVGNKSVPVLIEVKKREPRNPQSLKPESLKVHPGYARYAGLVGLPLLVAWQHREFWTLFDIQEATTTPNGTYKIDFFQAMTQNLLMLLAGDFSYRIAPGTAIRVRFKKLSPPDANGRIESLIEDVHLVNPAGERIPDMPNFHSLFLFWENEVEAWDEGDAVIQSFVIPPNLEDSEFASRTLGKILRSFSSLKKNDLNLRRVMHNERHWVHDAGEFRRMVDQGARFGVFTDVLRARPRNIPSFLRDLEDTL